MRLLLDACLWSGARLDLEAAGHEAARADTEGASPSDEELLIRAHREERVLVTLDKDFGELAIVRGLPHAGIVRLVGFRAREQGAACARALALYATDLREGALLTVEPGRIRVRPKDP